MKIITHNNKFLSLKNGKFYGSETTNDSLGFFKVNDYILFYDKLNLNTFNLYDDFSVYGYFFKIRKINDSKFSIFDPNFKEFISFIDADEKNRIERRSQISLWEEFEVDGMDELSEVNFDLSSICDLIKSNISNGIKRSILSAYLEICSFNAFEEIGKIFLEEDTLSNEIFPCDGTYSKEIRSLKEWYNSGRKEEKFFDIKQNYNSIYKTSKGFGLKSTEEKVLHSMRRNIEPIKNISVVATSRNEGVYIIDWISHYKSLGIEKIFIYTNNNTDGSDKLLKSLSDNGIITLIENDVPSGGDAQSKSYSHALMINKDILNYRWSLFVDMDEFFCLNKKKFQNINEFIFWQENYLSDIIAVNWTFVKSDSQKSWNNKPIYERFTCVENHPNPHIKSIIKPKNFIGSKPHYPCSYVAYNPSFREANKNLHTSYRTPIVGEVSFSDNPTNNIATIYHYFDKSAEEFLWKFSRNRGDYPAVLQDIYIQIPEDLLNGFIHNFSKVNDYPYNLMKDYIENNNIERNIILSIPDVNASDKFVVEKFVERMKILKEEFSKKEKTVLENSLFYLLNV